MVDYCYCNKSFYSGNNYLWVKVICCELMEQTFFIDVVDFLVVGRSDYGNCSFVGTANAVGCVLSS